MSARFAMVALLWWGCGSASRAELSVVERFAPCPESPNCVNSRLDPDHPRYVAPLWDGPGADEAWERVLAWLDEQPRVELVEGDEGWRHYTFTTRVHGYVDDVEVGRFEDRIDVRSASRVGWSDLGVNARRARSLRRAASN